MTDGNDRDCVIQTPDEWFGSLDFRTKVDHSIALDAAKEQRADLAISWERVNRKIELVAGFSMVFGGWLALNQNKLHVPNGWVVVSVVLSFAAAGFSAWAWFFRSERPMSVSIKSVVQMTQIGQNVEAFIAADTFVMSQLYIEKLKLRTRLLRVSVSLLALSVMVAAISSICLRDYYSPKSPPAYNDGLQ
jgi:hypothetical protein